MRSIMLAMAFLVAIQIPAAAMAQDGGLPSEAEIARLEELKTAADAIDPAGENARNEAAWQRALAYARSIYPEGHPAITIVDAELAVAEYFRGDVEAAMARTERALRIYEENLPEYRADLTSAQNALVVFYMRTGRTADAIAMAEAVLEQRREQYAADPDDMVPLKQLGAALNNLANAANEFGDYDRAVALITEAVELAPKLEGTVPGVMQWYSNRPIFLDRAGRPEEAFAAALESVAVGREMLPENHQFLALLNNTLAGIASQRGLLAEAEDAQRRAIAIMDIAGLERVEGQSYRTTLAGTLVARGKAEEALEILRISTPRLVELIGPQADLVLLAWTTEARAQLALGRLDAARALAERVLAVHRATNEAGHRDRLAASDLLARIEERAGDFAAAYAVHYAAQAARREIFPETNAERLAGEVRLGLLAARAGVGDARWALAAADELEALRTRLSAAGQLSGESFMALDRGLEWALEAALETGDADAVFVAASRLLPTAADRAARAAGERRGLDPEARAALRLAQDRRQELVRLSRVYLTQVGSGSDAELEDLRARIAALEADMDGAGDAVATAAPAPTMRDVQRRLGPSEAVLLTVPAVDRTAVIALTATDVAVHAADLDARGGARLVRERARGAGGRWRGARTGPLVREFCAVRDLYSAVRFRAGRGALCRAAAGGGAGRAVDGGAYSCRRGGGCAAALLAAGAGACRSARIGSADWLVRTAALVDARVLCGSGEGGSRRACVRRAWSRSARRIDGLAAPQQAVLMRSARADSLAALPSLPPRAESSMPSPPPSAADDRTLLVEQDADEASVVGALSTPVDVVAFATHGLLGGELAGLSEPALALTPSRRQRRAPHGQRDRRARYRCRLDPPLGMQHGRAGAAGQRIGIGGPVGPRQRLSLCRRAQPPRVALAGRGRCRGAAHRADRARALSGRHFPGARPATGDAGADRRRRRRRAIRRSGRRSCMSGRASAAALICIGLAVGGTVGDNAGLLGEG